MLKLKISFCSFGGRLMFETTVKKFFAEQGYGFLTNPMPLAKDIYFRARQRLKPGQKILVIRQEEGEKGPRAAKWREIKKAAVQT